MTRTLRAETAPQDEAHRISLERQRRSSAHPPASSARTGSSCRLPSSSASKTLSPSSAADVSDPSVALPSSPLAPWIRGGFGLRNAPEVGDGSPPSAA